MKKRSVISKRSTRDLFQVGSFLRRRDPRPPFFVQQSSDYKPFRGVPKSFWAYRIFLQGPPFRGNWGPRLWNEGQSMSPKWQSSNESESGIFMIISRICCWHILRPRTVSGPPRAVPGPPRTSIPPHSRTSVQRPSRAFGPRGLFPFFFIFARGAPLGTSPPAIPHLRYLRYGRYAPEAIHCTLMRSCRMFAPH